MRALDRKLLRDLVRLRGQMLAIALVLAAGVATVVLAVGTLRSLDETRRFAAGDRLAIINEDPADATLADLSITFLGKRT